MSSLFARGSRRVALKVGVGVALVASLGAVYAFKTVFARPGEEALRYIPADAMIVGVMDLSPSPQQALAFKRIDDAMERNDMAGMLEGSILDLFGRNPALDPLRPLVMRNGAIAYVPTGGQEGDMAGLILLALNDPAKAQEALSTKGKALYFRGTKYYTFKGVDANFMVMGDLLALGEKPASLHRARMVKEGSIAAITSVPEFAHARQQLAADANVMAFFNPKLLKSADVKSMKNAKASWLAAGLAIRDGGIGLSVWNQFDPDSIKGLAELGRTQEVRRDLFQVLPSGAYGVVALSQPANMFDQFNAIASQEENGDEMFADMEGSLQQNLGLDMKKDVLANLRGNAVIAAYPGDANGAGVDLLMLIDDANGSDPSAAVKRFQEYVEQQMAKEGNPEPVWVKTDSGFRIGDEMQKSLREGIGEGMDPEMMDKGSLVDKKTVCWAVVDKAIVASSSQELLDRAITSVRTRNANLASDTEFLKTDAEVLDGSQILAVLNIGRIAAGVGKTVKIDQMDEESADSFRTITGAFERLVDPFYLKARVGPDGQVATGAFIPIDYEKVFDFIGKEMKRN